MSDPSLLYAPGYPGQGLGGVSRGFTQSRGNGGPKELILPYAINMGDFALGNLQPTSNVLIRDPNQVTPTIINPFISGSYTVYDCKVLRIPIPTSGVGNNTQAVGFKFPAPLPIPMSGELRIQFCTVGQETPSVGAGDDRQEHIEMGIYREVGDSFADYLSNSTLYSNYGASYYRKHLVHSRSVSVADYNSGSFSASQVSNWTCTRIQLNFDTGGWVAHQYHQRNGFYKGSATAASGKLAAWVASDEGAPIAGIFFRNEYTTSLRTGHVNLAYFWIGMSNDPAMPPHNSSYLPASINNHA